MVIGGELQDRLIPVPYSKSSTDQAIRVVNAFRMGVDTRYDPRCNPSGAMGLHKQTSLSKRLSQTSSIEYADNVPEETFNPHLQNIENIEETSNHNQSIETAV
ncbi:hypothetical protein CHUAL_000981 [Chamberlinius hualienensis]